MSRTAQWLWSIALFLALWCSGVYLMYTHDYVFCYETLSCPISPIESVLGGLPFLTAQVAALYFILRPVSFAFSWGRALVALGAFAGWFYYVSLGVMHSPGWYVANLIWLFMVLVALSVLVLLSAGIVVARRFKHVSSGT